jgi:hypothetical protein
VAALYCHEPTALPHVLSGELSQRQYSHFYIYFHYLF